MSASTPVKLIFGGAGEQPNEQNEVPTTIERLKLLKSLGIKHIDSAQLYGRSEEALGLAGAGKDFIIDTKTPGGFKAGTSTKEGVAEHGKELLKRLGVDQVDVYYIHSPDPSIPLEETLEAVNELHKQGIFKRFGLSNFPASDVKKIYNLTKEKGWVVPSVYQGNYNAVARAQETQLFPTLRELGFSFYAYSPIAGGFLAKSVEALEQAGGRWQKGTFFGDLYRALYSKPSLHDGLEKWGQVAEKEGISRGELAYRWVAYNSPLDGAHGDGVIFGASSDDQIKETVKWLQNGPLSDQAVKSIDEIWESIKDDAPVDNYHSFKSG